MYAAPEQDLDSLDSLECHRAEARKYLPKTDEQYLADIEDGTDPYTGRWLGVALYAFGIALLAYATADMAGWV